MILTIIKYKIFQSIVALIVISFVFLILLIIGIVHLQVGVFTYSQYLILILVFVIRNIASRYNYKEISTNQIKEGMILSLNAVLSFNNSKISGLPKTTTEDLRSRLTKEEAESIIQWGNSINNGKSIYIVRKIPFAVFIAIGVMTYLILEVAL